jgi:hypothetical protein
MHQSWSPKRSHVEWENDGGCPKPAKGFYSPVRRTRLFCGVIADQGLLMMQGRFEKHSWVVGKCQWQQH